MANSMPNQEKIEFKQGFIDRYSALTDYEAFKEYSLSWLRRSIRVNTLKATVVDVKRRLEELGWTLTPIPWCEEGFWVDHETGRRDIGNTVEHALGYFYVQEAVSMVPPLALDVKPGMKILDMCAAPGSKTSQIAMMMKGEGSLIANDYKGIRLSSLGINLQRCGVANTIITLMMGESFKKFGEMFDRVLVDAPCSGTGTIRKSLKTLRIWNPHMVRKLAAQQLKLLETGFACVKPGGIVVYSTCSLEPEEDEGVISKFLSDNQNAKLEKIDLKGLKHGPTVSSFEGKDYSLAKDTLRLWPQDNDTEGFFVARIRKV